MRCPFLIPLHISFRLEKLSLLLFRGFNLPPSWPATGIDLPVKEPITQWETVGRIDVDIRCRYIKAEARLKTKSSQNFILFLTNFYKTALQPTKRLMPFRHRLDVVTTSSDRSFEIKSTLSDLPRRRRTGVDSNSRVSHWAYFFTRKKKHEEICPVSTFLKSVKKMDLLPSAFVFSSPVLPCQVWPEHRSVFPSHLRQRRGAASFPTFRRKERQSADWPPAVAIAQLCQS